MESNVLLTNACRICFSNYDKGVFVFSEEGKKVYLQAKIRKYLYITVSMDDNLPTRICDNCCKKIEGIHKFATMAVKNQDKFNKLLTDTNSENKKSENKGLLHTYLTKGTLEKQIDDTVEVEVKVDPMIFLQFNSEDDETDDEEDENLSDLVIDVPENTNNNKQETISKDEYEIKNYRCPICPRAYQSEFALQNHQWKHISKSKCSVLNNSNKFFCKSEKCDEEQQDDDISNIEKDASDNDDGESSENGSCGKFSCPICGKIISTKGNLKVHLETHRPKGKYGCDICGRIFKTQCNLHRHKEYHSGVQFTCAVCGRVYPTNSTLRAHSITHSNLRPHKCPLCDKTFKRNQDLKFHINQHTGARPYQCPYCPKAFASSGNCFSHRKRMHPFEVERDRERAAKIMR